MSDVTKPKPADLAVKKLKRDAGSEIDAFVRRSRVLKAATAQQLGRGRLMFALDATASRQPTWDMAVQIQGEMFKEVSSLDVQLIYYRGLRDRGLGECQKSGWVSSGERLANLMTGITCRAGPTQIDKVLDHACREAEKTKPTALVFVGDAMEENIDELAVTAGKLGNLGVKAFMFQEGDDPEVESAFREIARLTKGAYCRFDQGSAKQLAELLGAVAAYAAGGAQALKDMSTNSAVRLLKQLR